VAMPDGPFIHVWHAFLQMLGGTTDRAFRTIDLLVHVVGSGVLGAMLRPKTGSRPALVMGAWAALSARCTTPCSGPSAWRLHSPP
jgi:hypothetical protein